MNAAISRLDQCDRPVSAGGLVRLAARTRARIAPGTCSRPAPRGRSSRPAIPSAAYRFSHRSTVGRDTPAHAAISFFCRPSARHNTIRARVATGADVSAAFTSTRSSFRSSDVNSTRSLKHQVGADVKLTNHETLDIERVPLAGLLM